MKGNLEFYHSSQKGHMKWDCRSHKKEQWNGKNHDYYMSNGNGVIFIYDGDIINLVSQDTC